MSAPRAEEIVLEINHPRNGNVQFDPAALSLRSRFLTYRSGSRPQAPLRAFVSDPIPGQRIHLDIKRRLGRITDPLGDDDPKMKKLLETMNSVSNQLQPPRGQFKPIDDVEFRSLTEESVVSWLYYMHLLLEGFPVNTIDPNKSNELIHDVQPFAVLVQGTFPKEYPNSLACRQSGRVLTYNPKRMAGESKHVQKVTEMELVEAGS